MPVSISMLQELDADDPAEPLVAIALAEGLELPRTRTSPRPFVCSNGEIYWVKRQAYRGLGNELICGRLSVLVGAGSGAELAHVPAAAFAAMTSPGGVTPGLGCGSLAIEPNVNSKDVAKFLKAGGTFDPATIEGSSRATVEAFSTWVGAMGDQQVPIQLSTGRVYAVDHEESLHVDDDSPPQIVVAPIDGVPPAVGKDSRFVAPAIEAVEQVTEEQILKAVSCVPAEDEWEADLTRRFAIAGWLIGRQALVRPEVERWSRS